MQRAPTSVDPREDVGLAAQIMVWAGTRHLPVVDDNRLVGLLHERDVALLEARSGPASGRTPVGDLMEPGPMTASADEDLAEVAALMAREGLECLPVVRRHQLVGMITTGDILMAQVEEAAAVRERPAAPVVGSVTVGEVMTRDPATVHPDDRLLDAAARMQEMGIRHLPVVDGDQHVLGMLSDRDVRGAVGDPRVVFEPEGKRRRLEELRVGNVMSPRPITATADEPCSEASRLFTSFRVSAAPVVDAEDRIVGVLSYIDILRALAASGAPAQTP